MIISKGCDQSALAKRFFLHFNHRNPRRAASSVFLNENTLSATFALDCAFHMKIYNISTLLSFRGSVDRTMIKTLASP